MMSVESTVLMNEHERFMGAALAEAGAALKAGEFPVGVVLVADGEILVRAGRRNSRAQSRNEIDHAEINALRILLREHAQVEPSRVSVYSTMEPCLMCYSTLLLSGIRRFVWAYEDVMGGGTNLALQQLTPLYQAMQVDLVAGVLRQESLALFQLFFREHDYWQDSLLSRYTLSQQLDQQSDKQVDYQPSGESA